MPSQLIHIPTYAALCRVYQPNFIHNDEELDIAYNICCQLAGFDLNDDQDQYLDDVANFISLYEDAQERKAEPSS
jgi:hypothetical protein